ncbi:uncharacterized protein [Venturia canescens]|uniref:uncharacterized protein isoform X2 n=1 Tax=Venturia canescens TaxID=32260 RepID=UPI001C9C3ED4|nr:uncharacterized protein LOC122407248 isoform X2 [Venturia canescens]
MEDSYTVHRRRKAAARKREKTPEPPRRRPEDVTETDEEEDARARMERMVRETEMLEELDEKKRGENEKSGEGAEKSTISEEKPQRVMKRAVSPEVRRRDGENRDSGEKLDGKSQAEVSKRGKSEKSEKTGRRIEPKRTSGLEASPEVENVATVRVEETSKKATKNDASSSRNRRDPPRDLSPEVMDSGSSSTGKKMAADVEKPENIRSDERNREEEARSRNFGNSRKTSSRALDEAEREAETKILDENRREAVPRENYTDSAVSGRSGKSLKYERQETPAATGPREIEGKSVKHAAEEEKVRREVTSPSKGRSSEGRTAARVPSKRSSKDRLEKTGYTTDSSETEETVKPLLRRKKSPEGARSRSWSGKKIASRSRPTTDTEGDEQQQEGRKRVDKRVTSRRRRSSGTEDEDLNLGDRPRSPSTRADREVMPRAPPRLVEKAKGDKKSGRYSSDLSDDCTKTMSKSETFPSNKSAREKSPSRTKSSPEMKKQIIPLSDDSLMEDFERAQLDYLRKERSIFDPDPLDDYVDPSMEAAFRRRKFSIVQSKEVVKSVAENAPLSEKKSWFSWIPFVGKRGKKDKVDDGNERRGPSDKPEEVSSRDATVRAPSQLKQSDDLGDTKTRGKDTKKVSFLEFFRTLADFASEFRAFIEQNPRETRIIRVLRNRCFVELLFAIIYCGLGAFVFRFTEGAFETFYKCGVKRVKRDFLDTLWNFSHNMREEDWKSMARRKLMEFEEQLHTAHEAGVHSYSGQKSWSFLNAVLYCLTVITTIGYGHIAPSTTTGRAITIVYAIFGIPMFLIILADFGKLFTRGIKFLWAFVRRVYYTGSCRRVRRTVPVQEVMKGVQIVYDLATFRRPSQMNSEEIEEMEKQQNQTQTVLNLDGNAPPSAQPHTPGTPGTPALSTFAIDDEFNLPISVAIIILLVYIFVGATVYTFWEQWAFFESFYFVFISMSTIGFGDFVPRHPIYMMLSIVYLVFGLALTSMCINVVQVMLSESFRQASQKIGATIGFEVTEEDGSVHPAAPPPVEMADVHTTIKESESEEQIAPKAKQEDLEL